MTHVMQLCVYGASPVNAGGKKGREDSEEEEGIRARERERGGKKLTEFGIFVKKTAFQQAFLLCGHGPLHILGM